MKSLNWKGLKGNPLLLLIFGATIFSVIILIGVSSPIILMACLIITVFAVICFMVSEENEKRKDEFMILIIVGMGGMITSTESVVNPSLTAFITVFFLIILGIGSIMILATSPESKMVES